ncbi:MAG: glycosyltransferase family 4 protein [Alphaproteobacteria bacterium]|nr:glycosyltransferase family 4 protein [Alphaproteobacteria bacterium]
MPLTGATILQVIPELSAGGAERTTIEIATALKAAGASALVASRGGRLEQELAAAGGRLIRMDAIGAKNPITALLNTRALARIIRSEGVDIVHARSRAPAWSALWAARLTNRPFVTTYHGTYNARSSLKRLYNSIMARGDVVIANSEFTAGHILKEHPSAAGRIVCIPRGVDVQRFSPVSVGPERREALSRTWNLLEARKEIVILLPGRLTAWKGQRQAIRAVARLPRASENPWRLILAGDAQGRTAYVQELESLIAEQGLIDRVSLVGHCSDMPAAFSLADIVLAPSVEPEAFGRVAAEAGAMGKPVIGSDLGGQKEVIVDHVTGLLTPPGDVEAIAEAVQTLIDAGPERRQRMGSAAQTRICDKFTAGALQRATLSVYDDLIGRSA